MPPRFAEGILALFRVVVGLLFALHGAAKLFGLFGGVGGTGARADFAAWPTWWAGVIEFVGGTLVILGLGTRAAAVLCSGAMAYAYFVAHQPTALLPINNGGELAALFCWAFLVIAVIGPGPWSLDLALRRQAREEPSASAAAHSGP